MGGVTTTILEILAGAVVGAAMSAVPSYFLGRAQNRDQTRHEQRTEALTEIRSRILDLKDAFVVATNPPEYRLPEDPGRLEQAREVTRKLDELNGYYRAKRPWLEAITTSNLDALIEDFTDKLMKYQIHLEINASEELRNADPEAPYPEDEIAEDFHEWASANGPEDARETGRPTFSGKYLSRFIAEFEEEVDRVIGTRSSGQGSFFSGYWSR